jgi:hypothetical protein
MGVESTPNAFRASRRPKRPDSPVAERPKRSAPKAEGLDDIKREIAVAKTLAEDALREFEQEKGLATLETSAVNENRGKQLGPKTLEPIPEI